MTKKWLQKIAMQQEKIIALTKIVDGWKEENVRDDSKIAELEALLNLKNSDIYELRRKLTTIEGTIIDLESDVETFKSEITNWELKFEVTIKEREELEFNYKSQIEKLRAEYSLLNKERDSLQLRVNIFINENTSYKNTIQDLQAKLEEANEKIKNITASAEEIGKKAREAEKKLFENEHKLHAEAQERENLEKKVKILEENINGLTVMIEGWKEENAKDDARIAELETLLEVANNSVNEFRKKASELEVRVPLLVKDLEVSKKTKCFSRRKIQGISK